ncbi:MAG: D-tyrosyl-tRNA(Tyr) deacylase [Bacteroidales bacterium]|nr:D-tyrosyl-tRNA(Tyr) deacylase [Bacteroidales bacterium]
MRTIIQRVSNASVVIDSGERNAIGQGLLVFIGIEDSDGKEDIEWLCNKIIRLRIFGDEAGLMNLSVQDIHGEILVISQFTLHASTRKGNRPSFIKASKPYHSEDIYKRFLQHLQLEYIGTVKSGEFGAHMKIHLINDGPVTIFMDTKRKE